jgi:hypothetical protein
MADEHDQPLQHEEPETIAPNATDTVKRGFDHRRFTAGATGAIVERFYVPPRRFSNAAADAGPDRNPRRSAAAR